MQGQMYMGGGWMGVGGGGGVLEVRTVPFWGTPKLYKGDKGRQSKTIEAST